MNLQSALYGSLLGTAVGDAYGLPFEGMKPQRIRKIFKRKTDYRLIPFMHGAMVSDDTEHATMAVQAYIRSAGQPEKFQQALQSHLRWWLARLPAGIGLATLRSIVKMWFRLPETGVFSAGNGGAMRVAVLGVLARDVDELKQLVKISTHRPKSRTRRVNNCVVGMGGNASIRLGDNASNGFCIESYSR